jgi:phospholipid-binding lipoprotein MlaA
MLLKNTSARRRNAMSADRVTRLTLPAFCAIVLLAGCATQPPADDPEAVTEFQQTNDPLEPTNRVFYKVNDALDTAILKPVAQGYRYAVPQPVRNGVHNVLSNLGSPVLLTADVLQGKPRRAGDATMRFLINSTIGVAGIFDVADGWGYPAHDNDSGVTLANRGVPSGPFLFLPILGPSNPRDAVGFGADIAADPATWVGSGIAVQAAGWGKTGMNAVDQRERVLDPLDQIKKTALDPYATIRSLYRQHREAQIETIRDDNAGTIPVWFPQHPVAAAPAVPATAVSGEPHIVDTGTLNQGK